MAGQYGAGRGLNEKQGFAAAEWSGSAGSWVGISSVLLSIVTLSSRDTNPPHTTRRTKYYVGQLTWVPLHAHSAEGPCLASLLNTLRQSEIIIVQ